MIGPVSAVPYVFAFVSVIYIGYHSDLTGDRIWHLVTVWGMTSAGMAACILIGTAHPALMMVALTVSAMGQYGVSPVFWSLPTALLTGTAAAGGIAMISSVGSLGAWLGPWVFGLVKDATGSNNIALLCLALGPVISIIAILVVGQDRRLERFPTRRTGGPAPTSS
jgi:nitrate/nitrite transporter NarK